ncbi:MAG: ABC transporter substrate-binding protein [Deltaproteobacteria bacterium]|nr:ABC transporter substrate-binding protein [Deltaproteobacteria bacterium]
MNLRRLILPALLAVFTALGGFLCPLQAGEPVKLGEINPLSGFLAKHGWEIHQGILYAVEEVNARGGLAGRRVELLSRDDRSSPEVAVNQAQELIYRERVVGLLGGYVDSLVGPISQVAARHRVPYVASASLQSALTRRWKNPYFFRVSKLDGIVEPLCRFILEALKAKRAALLYMATPGSTEFAQQVAGRLRRAGVAIPLREKFRPGVRDFSVFLLKLRQARVEVLVSGGFYADNMLLVRQMREQGAGIRAFIAPWGVAYPSFIREMGPASEGLLGLCAWNPGVTLPGTEAASQAFVQGFRQRFGEEPNTTTMHGYTSARALLAALERVLKAGKPLSGEAIRRELARLDLLLPMERLRFDAHGDPLHYRQVVVQVQQRKMVVVYPPERATGKLRYPLKF